MTTASTSIIPAFVAEVIDPVSGDARASSDELTQVLESMSSNSAMLISLSSATLHERILLNQSTPLSDFDPSCTPEAVPSPVLSSIPAADPSTTPATLIGRSKDCDVLLDDPSVSRKHVQIARLGSEYILTDLDSLNGTYVNDQIVDSPTALVSGDQIRIGKYKYKFFEKD